MLKRMTLDLAVSAVAIALAITFASMGAQALGATAVPHAGTVSHSKVTQTAVKITAADGGAYTKCLPGNYCDFAGTSGTTPCLTVSVTELYWSDFGCRNIDESFANRTSGLVRLFYSPNLQGAWVCIDASKYSNNLAGYTFNNGPTGKGTGFGQQIENNVASSQTAAGNCIKALPWP